MQVGANLKLFRGLQNPALTAVVIPLYRLIVATALLSGRLVDAMGLGVIVWLNAALLAVAAGLGWLLPNRVTGAKEAPSTAGAWGLLRMPMFVRLMVVAALIGGSHALHDAFEVIRWRLAGLSPTQSSILWRCRSRPRCWYSWWSGRGCWRRWLGSCGG